MMNLARGTRLGHYEIVSLIGVGGMGEVYRARDTQLKREVAIKVLTDAWAEEADRLARFQREAELLATINHANIAAIYGLQEIQGSSALVLELVTGPTLFDLIASGPLPLDRALAIARQIADALDAAHERGIVHRDLKPANIKVREDGTVKVLDFGIAKVLATELSGAATGLGADDLTRAGTVLGTAVYMSPEQTRGQVVDRRTDIWAFGCILYEMLTARAAFGGATPSDVIAAVLEREPDWSALPSNVPSGVRSLLHRCLQKDRKQRLRDIGDARIEMESHGWDGTAAARPKEASAVGRRWTLGAVALASVALGVAVTLGVDRASSERAVAAAAPSSALRMLEIATTDDGVTGDPALSRDGALLAYSSDRAGAGSLDIWVQQTAGSAPLQLTSDPADELEPAFSADGSHVAYRSEANGGGIYIVPTLGGEEPRLLVAGGLRPRFSSDGRFVAYWAGTSVGFSENAGAYRTFVTPTGGGTPREIEGFTGARYPVWSPDSQSLLLLGSTAVPPVQASYDWWRVPLDGTAPRRLEASELLEHAGITFELGNTAPHEWLGGRILFSDAANLWSLQVDPETSKAVDVERLTFGTSRTIHPAASASGVIAFTSAVLSNSVWALPLDPVSGTAAGPAQRVTGGSGMQARPSANRDGSMVAYVNRFPRPSIHVKSLVTQRIVDLGVQGSAFGPALSPDGSYVAYEDGGGISLVSSRGGPPRSVCALCTIGDWSTNSREIFVVRGENNSGRLSRIEIDTGDVQDLVVSAAASVNRPFPSPDGRLLAFRRMRADDQTIFTVRLEGGRPLQPDAWHELVAAERDLRPAGWSADGALLYFVSGRDGFRCLYAQRVDAATGAGVGEPFAVYHVHGGRAFFRGEGVNVLSTGPANAIAGGYFFHDMSDVSANVWLMSGP